MADYQTHVLCSFHYSPELQHGAVTLLADSEPVVHTPPRRTINRTVVSINLYVINLQCETYNIEEVYYDTLFSLFHMSVRWLYTN